MLFVCIVSVIACTGQGTRTAATDEKIALEQHVTNEPKPQDAVFNQFPATWRKTVISSSAELTRPVRHIEPKPGEPAWAPVVIAQCVFSADAGGMVPQVTLSWNAPVSVAPNRAQARQEGQAPAADLRIDLALHHNGFVRNYYSTVLAADKLQRFKLPSNSALVSDQEAVLLTGPGLFPKLMDFRTEMLQERDTNRPFQKYTMILRDLSQGLTYTIRIDRASGSEWSEERRAVFLTPVCPDSF
jgi:hypothetical protein